MSISAPLVVTAVATFAATNIDGLAVVAPLYFSARGRAAGSRLLAGQLVGYAGLLALAALVGAGLASVPTGWSRLAGLVPIALGVRALITAKTRGRHRTVQRREEPADARTAHDFRRAILLTGITGLDNVAVLGPLFRLQGPGDSLAIAVVHLALLASCGTAIALVGRRLTSLRATDRRTAQPFIPWLYIVIGARVLAG